MATNELQIRRIQKHSELIERLVAMPLWKWYLTKEGRKLRRLIKTYAVLNENQRLNNENQG